MVCEVEFRDMKGSLVTLRHKKEEDSGYRLQSAQVLVTWELQNKDGKSYAPTFRYMQKINSSLSKLIWSDFFKHSRAQVFK